MLKRSLDFLGALGLLVVAWPVLIAVALAIRMQMGSPVLFRQVRPGLHGRPFALFKFRTMRATRPGEPELESDGVRLTELGAFLRRLSLDELPQLFNVLRGEMSFVGPRPLLMDYLPLYSAEQSRRHDVLPGITGWAQVNGRNSVTWDEKFALDLWYVDHQSLWLDAKIVLLTILRVIRPRGISQEGPAGMPRFRGNGFTGNEVRGNVDDR